MERTRLRLDGRIPRLVYMRLGLALAALSLTLSGTAIVSAQQAEPALQGRLFQSSAGALYVYNGGAKYLVNLASVDDDEINAIPDGPHVDRLDALFQETPTPIPPPAPTPTPQIDLTKALIGLSDVPAGWKELDPKWFSDTGIGHQKACMSGPVPPADGVVETQSVIFAPPVAFPWGGGEVLNQVGRFYPGAAKIYLDALANAVSDCPSYNAVVVPWDGPVLGDQTIRLAMPQGKSAAAVIVRIGDAVSWASTHQESNLLIDRQLLEHAAETATARLQAAMR